MRKLSLCVVLLFYSSFAWGGSYTRQVTDSEVITGNFKVSGLSTLDTAKYPAVSVADEGTIVLPTGLYGRGWAMAGDNEELISFTYTSAGTVTLLTDCTANTANSDSDTDLCVYDGGAGIIIKNRLGSTKVITYNVSTN